MEKRLERPVEPVDLTKCKAFTNVINYCHLLLSATQNLPRYCKTTKNYISFQQTACRECGKTFYSKTFKQKYQ